MTRTAIISDIHGNLTALEAVLEDINGQNVDRIVCLGDVIGYGPAPCECLDRAMEFAFCILGNHDSSALFDPEGFNIAAEQAIFWTRAQIECGNDGPEASDQFGFILAVSDMNGDGYDDLAVGAPYEDLETMRDVGLVHMLFGSPDYYFANAGQVITQETIGLGETEAYDMFGISLAIWPFPFPYTSTYDIYLPLLLK